MVATSHPAVTQAALTVLREGGNAVDAMLTAMPLQQVLEPQLSTIAGGFGMLHWDAATGQANYLNANPDLPREMAPEPADSPETSGARIGVPGTVAGMRAAADRFGTREWSSYFTRAIAAADTGFPVYEQLHHAMVAAHARITFHPSGRERYLRSGHVPPVGDVFAQPELAASLGRISESDGFEWFYGGAFAEHFVGAVRATGGTMTAADLESYVPRWAKPLRFTHRDHQVLGTPLPDTGGLSCAFALGVLERLEIDRFGPWPTSARAVALIARAQAEAEVHVDRYAADPLARWVPADVLLSDDYLRLTARLINESFPRLGLTADPGESVASRPPTLGSSTRRPGAGSNQLVIVDPRGNWVSMLHTGYGTDFGTGLVVDGIGVNSANVFPGVPGGPGRRIVAPLSSSFVIRDEQPIIALGTPGYPPPFVTLVLLNLLDDGMDLAAAISAPRFACGLNASSPVSMETRVPRETRAGLADLGISVLPIGEMSPATGRFQAVARDGLGAGLVGVVDPRGSGLAAGI